MLRISPHKHRMQKKNTQNKATDGKVQWIEKLITRFNDSRYSTRCLYRHEVNKSRVRHEINNNKFHLKVDWDMWRPKIGTCVTFPTPKPPDLKETDTWGFIKMHYSYGWKAQPNIVGRRWWSLLTDKRYNLSGRVQELLGRDFPIGRYLRKSFQIAELDLWFDSHYDQLLIVTKMQFIVCSVRFIDVRAKATADQISNVSKPVQSQPFHALKHKFFFKVKSYVLSGIYLFNIAPRNK